MSKTERGTLVKWNEAGGYGFIKPDDGSLPDLFFHIRDCAGSRPAIGSKLDYVPRKQPDGRWRAQAVRAARNIPVTDARTNPRRGNTPLPTKIATLLLAGFAATWAWATLQGHIPSIAQIYLLAINLITLSTYWRDKRAAERLGQRTPEIMLHGLELLGGWPAAWVAQRLFRHKSIKLAYLWAYLFMIVLNLVAFGIWLDAQLRINGAASGFSFTAM